MEVMGPLRKSSRKKAVPKPTFWQLRPVLEHRMPTLANKAAFRLPEDQMSAVPAAGQRSQGLRQLQQTAPPKTMRDVRAAVTKEIKSVTRKVARLEKEYYGEQRTIHSEVEKYVYPVKMMMKNLWILDLNKASQVEEMIKQSANPERYKGDPKYPAALSEVYAKIQSFLPDRTAVLVESCQDLLNILNRYCVSFYDAKKDCYLETAAHYSEQIAVWKEKVNLSIQSAKNLYQKFKTTGITIKMLSSPVAAFCSRHDMNKLLFLVMFADACTHIRNALSALALWLQTDENYATYVSNDLDDLEKRREEKMKVLRELRQKCHTLTYAMTRLECDYSRLSQELQAVGGKEQSLRIDQVSLVNNLDDLELEIEFKEKRRDKLKKRTSTSEHSDPTVETYETLTSELKSLKERLAVVLRALGQVRIKLAQVDAKLDSLDKTHRDIQTTKRELKQAEEERRLKEKEFAELELACQLARRIVLCKTANDATEKLYYSMPFGTKAVRAKAEIKDPMSQAFRIIISRIDRDWVHLYRNLNFYPQRGKVTIERDVAELTELGARTSVALLSRHALDRWKRYHTRANVDDLRQALRKIKRFDILKVINERFKSSAKVIDPFEQHEPELPPLGVKPELIPLYRLIERYDLLLAKKAKS